jgi:hypothetical protein
VNLGGNKTKQDKVMKVEGGLLQGSRKGGNGGGKKEDKED